MVGRGGKSKNVAFYHDFWVCVLRETRALKEQKQLCHNKVHMSILTPLDILSTEFITNKVNPLVHYVVTLPSILPRRLIMKMNIR